MSIGGTYEILPRIFFSYHSLTRAGTVAFQHTNVISVLRFVLSLNHPQASRFGPTVSLCSSLLIGTKLFTSQQFGFRHFTDLTITAVSLQMKFTRTEILHYFRHRRRYY
jgi:hypothetical protein